MTITRLVVIILLALLAGVSPHSRALAAPTVGIHLHTWHPDRMGCAVWDQEFYTSGRWDWWETRCRDETPGVYIRGERWIGGLYRNSIGKNSVYFGRTWRVRQFGPMTVDTTIFAVTGYGRYPVRPSAAIALGFPLTERVKLQIIPIPPLGNWSPAALHFALEFAP